MHVPGLLHGSILALATTGFSWILGSLVFGNSYFFARLLPVFMILYLLVAWLVHLRRDNFLGKGSDPAPASPESGAGSADPLLPPHFLADFSAAVLPRPPLEGKPAPARLPGADLRAIFLFASLLLAAISLGLYFAFGLGARYYIQ